MSSIKSLYLELMIDGVTKQKDDPHYCAVTLEPSAMWMNLVQITSIGLPPFCMLTSMTDTVITVIVRLVMI